MQTHAKEQPKPKPKEEKLDSEEDMDTEDPESELEIDREGCVEPDSDEPAPQGDENREVTEEEEEKANDKRGEASEAMSNGEYDKAIQLFTEAIQLNPHSVVLHAKRGQYVTNATLTIDLHYHFLVVVVGIPCCPESFSFYLRKLTFEFLIMFMQQDREACTYLSKAAFRFA